MFQSKASDACDAILALTPDGAVLAANGPSLLLFGYRWDELHGRNHAMLVPPHEREGDIYRQLWDGLRRGNLCSGVFRHSDRFGRTLWLHVAYEPVLDAMGRPAQVIMTATDLTLPAGNPGVPWADRPSIN